VTLAADVLVDGRVQKEFFYKELTPSNVIAVRLAVFNRSNSGVTIPIEAVELRGDDGKYCLRQTLLPWRRPYSKALS